jgi:hypothetical protein
MTFNIDWVLDESEEVTANSLLGDIVLSDGRRSVSERSVYLDSWLEALLRGTQLKIPNSGDATVSVPETPRPLRFCKNDGQIHIVTTSGREVIADSLESFRSAARSAAARFLKRTEALEGAPQNIALGSIPLGIVSWLGKKRS